jgi:uncharacterized membrane protein YhfC
MYVVAILIEIGLPVTLAILLIRKFKVAWVVVLTGVLTFIGSQVVHIPVLQIPALLYKAGVIKMLPQQWPIWAYALYLGLLAGLCEETARLIGFKILKNKAKDFSSSLALGIGHGGVESVIVGFIVLASLLSALLYNPQTQLAHGVAQDTVNAAMAQIAAFWSTAWHLPLAGGVERITAISAHLLMSVLVWQTVARGKVWGYPLAVLFHTVLDGVSVWLSGLGLSVWQLEGSISIFMVVSVVLIWRFWVKEKASNQAGLAEAGTASELEKPESDSAPE